MENSNLKRQREIAPLDDGPVGSRRRKDSSEYSTTSETNDVRDNEKIEEDSGSVEDENDDSGRMPSGSDGADADDEREEDEDDVDEEKTDDEIIGKKSKKENEKKEENDSIKDDGDSIEMDEDEEESSEDDEENDLGNSDDSDSDEEGEPPVLKRFPWSQEDTDNIDDEENMEEDVFYNIFVKEVMSFFKGEVEDKQLEEKSARAIWKMVRGYHSKQFAIIVGYTLFTTEKETFDHFLCEELVGDVMKYWKRHDMANGGDDFVKEVEKLEEEEQRNMAKKMDKKEDTAVSVKHESNSDETTPVSCVPEKKLRFKMLNKLINEDERVETNQKEWFLEYLEAYGEVNKQRADRAWEIVRKLNRGHHSIVGEVFYLTEREEVDIEFLFELVERKWEDFL